MKKVLIFALLFGLASAASAQETSILMATLAPKNSPWAQVLDRMADQWRQISGGKVRVFIRYGAGEDEPAIVNRLRIHSIQAVALSGAGVGDIDDGVACLQIPMLFDSYEELDYVRDQMAARLEKLIYDKGFVVLNWGDAGWVHFFSTQRIATLADLRKLKLFTWAGDKKAAVELALWKANGVNAAPLDAIAIGSGLATGLINAVPMPAIYAETSHIYETAKFMCDLKWAPLVGATLIDKTAWEKIPADLRARLLKAAQESGDALRASIRSMGDRSVATMAAGTPGKKSSGLTVVHADATAVADWRKQTEAIYPKIRGELVPADLFDAVIKLHKDYQAKGGKK